MKISIALMTALFSLVSVVAQAGSDAFNWKQFSGSWHTADQGCLQSLALEIKTTNGLPTKWSQTYPIGNGDVTIDDYTTKGYFGCDNGSSGILWGDGDGPYCDANDMSFQNSSVVISDFNCDSAANAESCINKKLGMKTAYTLLSKGRLITSLVVPSEPHMNKVCTYTKFSDDNAVADEATGRVFHNVGRPGKNLIPQ